MNVPQLRFKGFEEEWKKKSFYECVEIKGKLVNPRNEEYQELPHIGPGNIEKFTGKILKYELVKNEELISGKFEFDHKDVVYSKIRPELNKVVFPEFKGLCSADAYPLRAIEGVMEPYFLFQQLMSPKFIKYSISVSMRTGMPKINREELAGFVFYLPKIIEQMKISEFFRLLNLRLQKQQEKIEKLEQFKKGMMQKIFSQELRFKDEEGGEFPEWESTSLEKIAKIGKGFTPRTDEEELWGGDIPWLAISGMNQGKYILEASKTISNKAVVNKRIVPKGTLIMSFKLSIGKLGITKTAIYTNEAICHFYWTTPEISTEFMYYYLSTLDIKSFGSRAAKGVTLNNESLNAIVVKLPRIEEQDSIAKFLGRLDEKAEKEKEKLMILEEQKRGFMQEMFV